MAGVDDRLGLTDACLLTVMRGRFRKRPGWINPPGSRKSTPGIRDGSKTPTSRWATIQTHELLRNLLTSRATSRASFLQLLRREELNRTSQGVRPRPGRGTGSQHA